MTALLSWQNDLDASAALFVDGELVGAVSEERFTRVKQQTGFPAHAVAHLLTEANVTIADIDEWPYGFYAGNNGDDLMVGLCERVVRQASDDTAVSVMLDRLRSEREKDATIRETGFVEAARFGIPLERVRCYEHHPCHAWSAFAFSGFSDALVVTADGRGDRKSITVSTAHVDHGLTEIEWYSSIDSLGHLYSQVTAALGYTTNRHEGKITALAGHGNSDQTLPFLSELIGWSDDRITANPGARFIPSDRDIPATTLQQMQAFAPADLAAGVQALVERLLCQLIRTRLQRTGQRRVAVAGGLFANISLNKRIRELPDVDDVFVQPNMGDGGLPLGAGAIANHRRTGEVAVRWHDMYLGPTPGETHRLPQRLFSDDFEAIAWIIDELSAGRIIGLVRGRCEFGPRALCNRSILAEAVDPAINDLLNRRLRRSDFMPFAPVLTDRAAADGLKDWPSGGRCASHMTMAYTVTTDFADRHPAVVHVDGTARPQVVDTADRFLYDLLERYQVKTGRSALINTSFNLHEEPIVLTLDDGLRAMDQGAVDAVCTERAAWIR